jgi:hypothetical protein
VFFRRCCWGSTGILKTAPGRDRAGWLRNRTAPRSRRRPARCRSAAPTGKAHTPQAARGGLLPLPGYGPEIRQSPQRETRSAESPALTPGDPSGRSAQREVRGSFRPAQGQPVRAGFSGPPRVSRGAVSPGQPRVSRGARDFRPAEGQPRCSGFPRRPGSAEPRGIFRPGRASRGHPGHAIPAPFPNAARPSRQHAKTPTPRARAFAESRRAGRN